MQNFIYILLFLLGIIIIVKGGDLFVDAATWIAEVSGIPKFIVGATIVSLATTLPELLVSCLAAAEGKVDMAIGNAIGSVTANTALIMSISILFMSITIKRKHFMPKGLLLITALSVLWIVSLDNRLTTIEGLILIAIFVLFIIENIKTAKETEGTQVEKPPVNKKTIITNVIKFIVGTAGIVIGSRLLVDNGTELARILHVPENIISLTCIAIGTSLPELVTTITAIIKKESSISVGNIVGANLIDTALILPICSFISKGSIPVSAQNLMLDFPICLLVACIAIIPAIFKQKFYKWQGILMFTIYIGYIGYISFFPLPF